MKATALIAVVAAGTVAGCAHRGRSRRPPRAMELGDTVAGVDAAAHAHDAVFLERRTHIEFVSASAPAQGYVQTVRATVQILKPAGRRFSRVLVPLGYWSDLVAIGGRSYEAAEASVGARDVLEADAWDVSYVPIGDPSILYSDSRVAVLDIPGGAPGRIVEYSYAVRSRSPFGLPDWVFETDVDVLESSAEVLEPSGWTVGWGYRELGQVTPFAPAAEPGPGGRWLRWVRQGLAALEPEDFGLEAVDLARRLTFSVTDASGAGAFADWRAVAAHYGQLVAGMLEAPEEALAGVRAVMAKSPGLSREAATHEYVRDRIRYVAIEEGLGALAPHPAAEVHGSALGDCKDMAILLVALYRAQGIDAHTALISTRGAPPLHPEVPTLGAFNHAIVALRRDGVWVFSDPTAKDHPFGEVPWALQGRPALIVGDDAPGLVEVPVAPAARNRAVMRWVLGDDERFDLELRLTGERAAHWRGLAGSDDEARLRRAVRRAFLDSLPGSDVETATVTLDAQAVLLRAAGRLRAPSLAGRRFLPLGALFGGGLEVRVPEERKSDLDLGYPETWEQEVVLKDGLRQQVERHPPPFELDNRLATYKLAVETSRGELLLRRTYVQKTHTAPAAELAALRSFNEALTRGARDALVLK